MKRRTFIIQDERTSETGRTEKVSLRITFTVRFDQLERHFLVTEDMDSARWPAVPVEIEMETPSGAMLQQVMRTRQMTAYVILPPGGFCFSGHRVRESRATLVKDIENCLKILDPWVFTRNLTISTLPDGWIAFALSHLLARYIGANVNGAEGAIGFFSAQLIAR